MPKVSKNASTKKKPQYDPKKNYEWQPDDEFTLTGVEFSTVFNTLKEAALSPSGTSAASTVTAYNVLHSVLVLGIEEGVIKEVKAPEQPVKEDPKPTLKKEKKPQKEEGEETE